MVAKSNNSSSFLKENHDYIKKVFFNNLIFYTFKLASHFTEPICKSHEYYRRIYLVDHHNTNSYKLINLFRKIIYLIKIVFHASIACITTIPAVFLRFLAKNLQKHPFLHVKTSSNFKTLDPNKKFTILSWNICCIGGGYSISDGGVMPWKNRIDKIIDKILNLKADVNCLYETFDTKSAFLIYNKLKKHGYNEFYFNIGPAAIGVSSGIFVASKYEIKDPFFLPFSKKTLVGRTKRANKGVFSFSLSSENKNFANIFTTHLQHSEECEHAVDTEIKGREAQMKIITNNVKSIKNRCTIVLGDLNLDDNEYNKSFFKDYYDKGQINSNNKKTWAGDEFCAKMVNKKISTALNLDHTMLVKNTAKNLITTYIDTNHSPIKVNKDSLSDHLALFSEVTLF
jgi:endonuclease/exonuclease/phosphatase family metal-dependent hydrolase